MSGLNSVLLEGNLTRDPVLAETPKGTPVCHFGLAVNRYYSRNEEMVNEVSFFDVETWSRLAQYCGAQLKKGSPLRVVGRLKQERWEDGEGKNHTRVKVVCEHLEIPDRKKGAPGEASPEEQGKEDLDIQQITEGEESLEEELVM